MYVGERGSRFADMTKDQAVFDSRHAIFAGKFRRYHGESWLKRLLDVKTNLLNLRDAFYLVLGTVESWFLLRRLKPDVILLKGGFVGVPVGFAARNSIPLVTHDSDALPGLANRLVGRWAVLHATGMPAEFYQYPKSKVEHVGVLVSQDYHLVTPQLQADYRRELKLPVEAPVLMITGGSLGAQTINQAVAKLAPALLEAVPDLRITHQVGRGNTAIYGDYQNDRLEVRDLIPYSDLFRYSGAADVIITRAGANTMAEFGIQAKACIVVPNPLLTGGHQLKNAAFLAKHQAAVIVEETELSGTALKTAVTTLLSDTKQRQALASHLHDITVPDAAQKLAEILLSVGKGKQG